MVEVVNRFLREKWQRVAYERKRVASYRQGCPLLPRFARKTSGKVAPMAVNAIHPDYDASAADWLRARDVLSGEDAVKAGGDRYLPRLDSQTDEEFSAYRRRASFFNASTRTADGYIGLIFRRPPFVKVPDAGTGVGKALAQFVNDADMLGTSLYGYTKNVVYEVIGVGRAGTLMDWEGEFESRVYASLYTAEQIINWRVERVNGRNVPTLIVLHETVLRQRGPGSDEFVPEIVEQVRVLRLIAGDGGAGDLGPRASPSRAGQRPYQCVVEI